MERGLTVSEVKKPEVENVAPRRGKWVMRENGTWEEGSAKPELLREDLRALPSELVTKDIADPKRVHELDAEHIQENLVRDWVSEQNGMPTSIDGETQQSLSEQAEKMQAAEMFNRTNVDLMRLKTMYNLMNCKEPKPFRGYLWFPEANFDRMELREGPCPLPGKRPAHLRDLDLVVDPFDPPESLMRFAADRGVTLLTRAHWEAQALRKVVEAEHYVKL
jgi:hypothetical protein